VTALLFNLDEVAPRIDRENLSAWFTPGALARRMVAWCGDVRSFDRVLEPSTGRGSLVEAIRERSDLPRITAHELDPRSVVWLRGLDFPRVDVVEGDSLAAPAPAARYDLAVMNPPYEDGQDGLFLEKAMDESDRVVALVRLVALAGQERYRRVWSRVGEGREWSMPGLAILSARPDFGGDDGAKADFAVVKLSRLPAYDSGRTAVEWW
jgi:methylase of polypeptide subunit release factors